MEDENMNLIDDHEEAMTAMDEIDSFDFSRAMMLLNVMKECANTGPKATAIAGLAAAALNEMAEEAKDIGRRRSEEIDKMAREAAVEAEKVRRQQALDEEAAQKAAKEASDAAAREPEEPVVAKPIRRAPVEENGRRL